MSEESTTPPVACTLTEAEEEVRTDEVHSILTSMYEGFKERDDGYTLRFAGTDEALTAIANFVSTELHCCSFGQYRITVSPPYDETWLTITGPEGTKDLFWELVDRLEAETTASK